MMFTELYAVGIEPWQSRLSANHLTTPPGVTIYVIAWMLQTRSMAPSLIYTVSFSLRKIIQISVFQN